uniref:Putative glutamine amidotransferase YLR126C n=1 Tax=Anthurium amnicola TaxID=1678845 RepID=A0A1D1XI07_9ARAE
MRVEGERRYALLLAARDSDYVRKVYGGYFNVFVEAFGGEGDRWDLFRVVDGEFPDPAELRKYQGFVVSGSPHDAYADDVWILRLCVLLQTLHAMRKRVLGICFGHQILCRSLGGRVGKAHAGWNIGIRKVEMAEGLLPFRFVDGSRETPSSASIIKIHRDEVWEVPRCAKVIASSDQTSVEAFCVGDHLLGIQGHPEYTKDILCRLVDRLVGQNLIERDFGDDVKANMEGAEPDRKFWQKLCQSFLKGR